MTEERRRRKAYLQVVRGPGAGTLVRVDADPFHMGREDTNDLVLPDPAVLPIHARLEGTEGGRYRLVGLAGLTAVEGQPDPLRVLEDGDRIVLGDSIVLRFGFVEPSQRPPAGAPPGEPVADRRGFMRRLSLEMKARPQQLAVALVESDGASGPHDEEIPRRLRQTVRAQDHVGRVSPRQWAVIFPDLGLEEVERVLERVRQKILEGQADLRVSLGATSLGSELRTAEELVLEAEMALAGARQAGGNQVGIRWPPLEGQEEKRHKVRLRCQVAVLCEPEDGGPGFPAVVRDVSPHGMGLTAAESLALGTGLSISHEGGGPVQTRVVRCRARPNGEFLVGLAYDDRLENLRISWLRPYLRSLGFAGAVPIEERRHQMRLELHLSGLLRNGPGSAQAWVVNLSLGGALLRSLQGAVVGDAVELETSYHQHTLRIPARVVGAADAGSYWRLNLAFDPLTTAQEQWVARILAGQKKVLRGR